MFFVKPGDTVRTSLNSKKFKNMIPILLSNTNLTKKSRSSQLNLNEIRAACKISKADLEQRYDYDFGTFDHEGTWSCDIVLDKPGSYFLQVVFIPNEESKGSDSFTISGKRETNKNVFSEKYF